MLGHSGIGTYLSNVLPRVIEARQDWTFSLLGDSARLRDLACGRDSNVRIVDCTVPIYSLREQVAIARRVPCDATAVWAPHYNIPLLSSKPLVVTVHDLAHLRLPEYGSIPKRAYGRLMFKAVRRRAASVMFDSGFTRGEFETLVGKPRGYSSVVHPGIGMEWFERPAEGAEASPRELQCPYFVYVGNLKPHKNVRVLVDAFSEVTRALEARLVIIGQRENLRTADARVVEELSLLPNVLALGTIDAPRLRSYVRHAAALVLPSLYEGFGFPPLEAMAAGCPAIVSRAGSLPEVCGDAALYFEPNNPRKLAALMSEVARNADLRAAMVARGSMHARWFDWAAAARKVSTVLDQVLATRDSRAG